MPIYVWQPDTYDVYSAKPSTVCSEYDCEISLADHAIRVGGLRYSRDLILGVGGDYSAMIILQLQQGIISIKTVVAMGFQVFRGILYAP